MSWKCHENVRFPNLRPSALVFQRLGISALGLLSSCHLAQLLQQGFVRCVQRCMQRVGRAMDSCEGPWGPWPRPRGPPEAGKNYGKNMEKCGKTWETYDEQHDEHWIKHWVKQWFEAVNPMVVVESSSHLYILYIYHCIMLTFTKTDEHGWKWWRLDTFGTLTPEVTADSPSVAADYGDRAILYKPEGWEAPLLHSHLMHDES